VSKILYGDSSSTMMHSEPSCHFWAPGVILGLTPVPISHQSI